MFTFKKSERLCGTKQFAELFASGRSFVVFPYRIVFLEKEADNNPAVLFAVSIPRRRMKRAVDRNKLKRRTREVWRKNKADLIDHFTKHHKKCYVAFIYLENDLVSYQVAERKIKDAINRLIKETSEYF
ncbi:MAG: ribonuclease P protein component [Bacteroidetes bacterium]|nr:ribonuclease P protein component [Bacteroidota bacterium]MBU1720476.1 ribonuclease P protein component [Bacteroidota bacterium]